MVIKDRYADVKIKRFSELKQYFEIALCFDKEEKYEDMATKISKIQFGENRVWVLLGCIVENEWDCLQVAQTKDDMFAEIMEDVGFMLSYNYSQMINSVSSKNIISKHSTFYEDVYLIDKEKANQTDERRKFSYSKMKEEYKHFMICFLKVDEYLKLNGTIENNENVLNMIEIAKSLYAEAMIAYDMMARYWNMYNSGVDGQAIMCFCNCSGPLSILRHNSCYL